VIAQSWSGTGQPGQTLWFETTIVPHGPGQAPKVTTPGDLNGDGVVGIQDFLAMLAAWGPCPDPCPTSCAADLDGDCNVGIADFLMLLALWS